MINYLRTSVREESVERPSKLQVGIFSILLIITIALSIKNYDSVQLGTYGDDSDYAVLAQSIAFSDRYGLISAPGQPQPTRFPFGFPLLLSPFAKFVPDRPALMTLVSLLATLLSGSLLFLGWPYLSQSKSYWWGVILAALFLTSPIVFYYTHLVGSEPVFTTLTLAVLILTEKYLEDKKILPLLLIGGIAAFALFVRTAGIALWISIIVRILLTTPFTKSLKMLGYLLGGGIAVILIIVMLTPVAIPDLVPVEYVDQLQRPSSYGQSQIEPDLIPRLLSAFGDYATQHFRSAIIPLGGGETELEIGKRIGIANLPMLMGLGIGILILLGSFAFLWKKGVSPTVYVFEVLYFSIILLWPWRDARFLYPILPFLYYQFLLGILLVIEQIKRIRLLSLNTNEFILYLSVGAVIAVTLLGSIYNEITNVGSSLDYAPDLRIGTTWLRENSATDAIIMASNPQITYLYAQRKSVYYPSATNESELEEMIQKQGVDYILVTPKPDWRPDGSFVYDEYTSEVLLPNLYKLTEMGQLRLVYESRENLVYVYRVLTSQ